ncbi:hypothetical protein AgCh_017108 [Apium graveolens]
MKEVTFKNVKCKTGGLIPRKGDARDSMSFDSMNWKGLREYRRNDSRITLEVLQGESEARVKPRESMDRTSKGRNCSGQLEPKIKDVLRKAKEVADTLKDEVVERKMLRPAVVQRTKDMIDLIRGRLVVAQDGHDKIDEVRKERKAKSTICWTLGYIKMFGKLAYELALPQNM